MGLSEAQRTAIQETINDIDAEINAIAFQRENVHAALRLDLVYPLGDVVEPMTVVQDAKIEVIARCNALIGILTP